MVASNDEDALEVATRLLQSELAGNTLATINIVGELLAMLTARERKAAENGEEWAQGPPDPLTPEQAIDVLRGLTDEQLLSFSDEWECPVSEILEWRTGQHSLPGWAFSVLADPELMHEITGGDDDE
jgi:hypothetical protein